MGSRKNNKRKIRDTQKKPSASTKVRERKQPRAEPFNYDTETIVWSIMYLDVHCQWGWGTITAETLFNQIFPKLQHFESMTWAELKGRKSGHSIPVCNIIPTAQKRLQEIKLDDYDSLFRLGLGGKPRVWGIRDGQIFRVLWYDPEHEIYKVSKRYT